MSQDYTYIRGSKSKGFMGSHGSLWWGDDHLLLVQNMVYNQNYRRFFFKDIQALLITPNSWQLWWGLSWGSIMLLFASLAFIWRSTEGAFWPLAILALLFLVVFLTNLIQGPFCTTHIQTRVQTCKLPMVRIKRARKIFQEIGSRIEQEQGSLSQEELHRLQQHRAPDLQVSSKQP